MSPVLTHATPTEIKVAPLAIHVRTASILLNANFAIRTLANVTNKEKAPEIDGVIAFTSALMVGPLTVEARIEATLVAD
jgi:hypothetical protein